MDDYKEYMMVLYGILMVVSGGGYYLFFGCLGVYKVGWNILSGIKCMMVDFELVRLFFLLFDYVEFLFVFGFG